ncbi:MAG TPA: hypothetical protein VGM54_12090 [Chthoniobacter sp.]|jgi:hypothetical protein
MNFKFACPNCGQRIGATLEDVGTIGGCPSCQQQFTVPAPADSGPTTETVPSTVKVAALSAATRPRPTVETVTKRGLAIFALILSIFPVFNLIALALAIYAVVRSDRPGRAGERGIAVTAVTIASLLVLPLNIMVPLGTYFLYVAKRQSMTLTTSGHETISTHPSPTPAKH